CARSGYYDYDDYTMDYW
nr:immunoglobulin heavy chain junction region [Mus musculus]MBK4198671.1 immunoglobulin heavy chain junction region [Mus musculus]